MSIELRKWLNRAEKSHTENLEFGMKVWNSIEFNLLTKHEIIIEEGCKIVQKLAAECKTAAEIDTAWSVINEFLGLKCPSGAIVSAVKITLINTLLDAVNAKTCRRHVVYKGVITTLQNSMMQSFFKSSSKHFARLTGAAISYAGKMLESSQTDSDLNRNDPLILEVVQLTKNYIKQTPFLNDFRIQFVKHLMGPLSELFIGLRKDDIIDEGDLFNILHEIYFADNDEKQSPLKQLLLEPENEKLQFLLRIPVHSFMLVVEGAFLPLKVDTSTQGLLIKFLLNNYFKESNEKFTNEQQMLLVLSLFLSLLKRYDVSLNFDIDGTKAIEFLGKSIESLTITESNLYGMLLVLCALIELNPMMLEHSLIPIVVKCMLHRKDDRTAMVYEKFLILMIDTYRRLSRTEKFISNLIRTSYQRLTEVKLSKKIKRKIGGNVDANASVAESPKRQKLDSTVNSHSIAINDTPDPSQVFLQLLVEHFAADDSKPSVRSIVDDQTTQWKNIQFAWPNRVGEAFSKFISGLVSKPSLVVWKTLIFTMTDYVALIKDGDLTENTLFLIDWTSAMLCQYFHGCRLAEQSDKTWELIEKNRKFQRTLLKAFGNAILSQEHNIRTMNAFLSLCFAAGNFDLLSWFYRPDSISAEQIEGSLGDSANDFIHSYLQPTEWVLIEQRISNFGKHECRSNLNRLYMQKIKSKLVIKQLNESMDITNHLLPSVLGDHEDRNELNDILVDETSNQWFVEQLTPSQKIQVARNVVELDCNEARESHLTRLLANNVVDQKFLDYLAVAMFERISLDAGDEKFFLKRIDFDDIFGGNESVCKDFFRVIKSSTVIELDEQSQRPFQLLDVIPLGYVSPNVKNILLHLTLGMLQYGPKESRNTSCKYLKSEWMALSMAG